MSLKMEEFIISDGIKIKTIIDKKFKSNLITIRFITKLDEKTVSQNAIIPNVLVTTNSTYKTRTELITKLSELYGSGFSTINHKIADNQVVGICASCICDAYVLDGKGITSEVTEILLDCIFNPIIEENGFGKHDFEIRKTELVDSIDGEINDKRTYAIKRANASIYKNEPSALTSYGTKDGAIALTPQNSYSAYKDLLKTAQIEIMYCGGEENVDSIEKLKNSFSSIERAFSKNVFSTLSPLKNEVCEDSDEMDVNQCKMVMAYKSDFNSLYANRLMSTMLGGTAFSKLFTNVREKFSLCYYCAAGFVEGKGVLIIDSGVELSNIPKAREEINNQIIALANGDFTDEEMNNAVLSISGDYKSNYDSTHDISSWYFIQGIRGDNFTPEQAIKKLKSVTREDIIKSASSLKLDTVYIMKSNASDGGAE